MTPHHHSPEIAQLIELAELRDHRANVRHQHRIARHDIDGDAWVTCACGWTSVSRLNSTEPIETQVVKHMRHVGDGAA